MLSPERIERVGRAEGEIAAELQEALLRLVMANVRAALERGGMGVDALFRLSLDVQQQALREIARRNPEMVAEAARDVTQALAESMDDDLSRIGTTLGELPPHVAADMHRGAATTAQGVAEIVRRDNLSMADDARRQFLNTTSTHVSLVNAGQLTFEEAVRAACAELAASGVRCVDYASGQRADLDVAIRRHVRSQINQAGNRRTMQLMEECGVGFVEVSSHVGARPSHRAWQGRCYSLNGRQVVGGEVYEDFWEATGYQGRNGAKLGDRLCGVNCRHSFGPYLPGEPRAYSPTPDEDAGLDPDEAYAATQRQRELERRVRRAKREAEAKEAAGGDASAERAAVRKAQRDVREHVAGHEHLGRQYGRERSQGLTGGPIEGNLGSRAARGKMFDHHNESFEPARSAYRATDDPVAEFRRRTGSDVEFDRWFERLPREKQEAILTGLESGMRFVGEPASGMANVRGRKLGRRDYAQHQRREGDRTIVELNTSKVGRMTADELEQVMFHEVAHCAEYGMMSWDDHQAWQRALGRYEAGRTLRLDATALSTALEESLVAAGIPARYNPFFGKIVFSDNVAAEARSISEYAVEGADFGHQDGELAAESIRFVANHGFGQNQVADAVVRGILNGRRS